MATKLFFLSSDWWIRLGIWGIVFTDSWGGNVFWRNAAVCVGHWLLRSWPPPLPLGASDRWLLLFHRWSNLWHWWNSHSWCWDTRYSSRFHSDRWVLMDRYFYALANFFDQNQTKCLHQSLMQMNHHFIKLIHFPLNFWKLIDENKIKRLKGVIMSQADVNRWTS